MVLETLQAGLKAAGLRQSVIADNLANLNTPNFRRNAVRFEEMLAEAMESGRIERVGDVEAEVFQPRNTKVNSFGNDVDLDVEIGELLKNSGRYKVLLKLMAKQYRQMELAMRSTT
jgi:flagellar basal-body rod protein FlgB